MKKLYCLVFVLNASISSILGQCPLNNVFPAGDQSSFSIDKEVIATEETINLTVNANYSQAVKTSSRYLVRLYNQNSSLNVSDFGCNSGETCTGSQILYDTSGVIKMHNGFANIRIDKPGVYSVFHFYNDPIGKVTCKTIVVKPKINFDYTTCSCNKVNLTIDKSNFYDFYDEWIIDFGGFETQTIKKSDLASKNTFSNNTLYSFGPNTAGQCIDRGSFKVTAVKRTNALASGKIETEKAENPIKFSRQNSGTNDKFITHLSHEENGDILLKASFAFEGLSYGLAETGPFTPVLASSMVFNTTKREVKASGLPIDTSKLYFFKPTLNEVCPFPINPVGLYGQIKEIKSENSACNELQNAISVYTRQPNANYNDIYITVKSSTSTKNISTIDTGLSFLDENVTSCDTLVYRTFTLVPQNGSVNQVIYSKPVKFKPGASGEIPSFGGQTTVNVLDNGRGSLSQVILYSNAPTNPTCIVKSLDFYKADYGTTNFIKDNPTPLNTAKYEDRSSTKTASNGSYCYQMTYTNLCGQTSKPTLPVCTVWLSVNGDNLEWTGGPIGTTIDGKNYASILGYILEEVDCSSGSCVPKSEFEKTSSLFKNIADTDTDPNVHSKKFRINVKTVPSYNTVSNVIDFFYPAKLYIPEAFTPNDDTVNPHFEVFGTHVKNLNLDIFDRWGTKVKNITAIGEKWDGTINGQPAPEGIYLFKASATDYSPEAKTTFKSGSIKLIR